MKNLCIIVLIIIVIGFVYSQITEEMKPEPKPKQTFENVKIDISALKEGEKVSYDYTK